MLLRHTDHHFTVCRAICTVVFVMLLAGIAQGQSTQRVPKTDTEPLNVYPNPTAGKFSIVVKEQENQYDVNIYNLMGEMVFHWESADQGTSSLEVDLSKRPDGVYFVELDTDKANVLKRLVLDRQR